MSTGVGMGACCLSGSVHKQAQPTGRVETIGGIQTYVAETKDGSKEKSIIFLVDIFGWEFPNVRLLADEYAKAGFYSYVPDVHDGDSIHIDFLQTVEPPLKVKEQQGILDSVTSTASTATTLGPWMIKHREAVSRPIIDGFVNSVRTIPGTNKIGAIGFCWGGRYAILQAHGPSPTVGDGNIGGVDAAFAAHPSMVAVPGDFDDVKKPLSIALGTKDSLVDEKTRNGIQEICSTKLRDVPTEVRIYEDQIHGFALRGDWSSEKDKEAMDESTNQGLEWFRKYL